MSEETFVGAFDFYKAPFKPIKKPAYMHATWTATDNIANPQFWQLYVQIDEPVFESMHSALTKTAGSANGLSKLYQLTAAVAVQHDLAPSIFKDSSVRVSIYTGMHPTMESGILLVEWFDKSGKCVADASYSNLLENVGPGKRHQKMDRFTVQLLAAPDSETGIRSWLLVTLQPPAHVAGCCGGGCFN